MANTDWMTKKQLGVNLINHLYRQWKKTFKKK